MFEARTARGARRGERGLSAIELLAGIALLAIAMLMIPSLTGTVQRQRAAALTRQLTGEIHRAQSEAISTGWQVRLVGYGSAATNGRANQYRLLGRASTLTAWPDPLAAPFSSATQSAGPWVDVPSEFGGVAVNGGSADAFWLTFDPRGAVVDRANFSPLTVEHHTESATQKRLVVSATGTVRIE